MRNWSLYYLQQLCSIDKFISCVQMRGGGGWSKFPPPSNKKIKINFFFRKSSSITFIKQRIVLILSGEAGGVANSFYVKIHEMFGPLESFITSTITRKNLFIRLYLVSPPCASDQLTWESNFSLVLINYYCYWGLQTSNVSNSLLRINVEDPDP